MTEKSIGSVFIDVAGCELSVVEKEVLAHPQVGGLVLFSRNFEHIAQLADLVKQIRSIRPNILLTVDQEGGRVQRFKHGFTRLPSMQLLADHCLNRNKIEAVADVAWVMAAELRCLDIDLSFAPVLDADRERSDVIGDRSFSDDPEQVIQCASAFIQGMNDAGMQATGKHFPGHGGVSFDTHLEVSIDHREFKQIERCDLKPFAELAKRLGAIMPAHVIFDHVDDNPVGFSAFWLKTILRESLGYQGVIVSDDLKMAGAASAGGISERANAAMTAGCDAVLVCNAFSEAIIALESLEAKGQKASVRINDLAKLCRRGRFPSLVKLRNEARWINTQNFLESVL